MHDADDTNITGSQPDGKRGRPYHAYLLRCWRESATPGGEGSWRFSIEGLAPQRQRRGFGSLQALAEYIKMELGDEGEADGTRACDG